MLKSLLTSAAAIGLWAGLIATPALADSSWRAKEAFEHVCNDVPALVVVLDMTSRRHADEIETANTVTGFIADHMQPGRQLVIYQDFGDGRPQAEFEGCKPVVCDTSHVLWRTIKGVNRACTKAGYEKAEQAFAEGVTSAFAPYYEDSRTDLSPLFRSIAVIGRDLRAKSIASAQMVFLSDGLPNSKETPFSTKANWLTQDAAREQLAAELDARGALMDLSGYEVQFVLSGRPLSAEDRLQDKWLSAEESTVVEAFWQWYGTKTNTTVTWSPFFDAGAIALSRNDDNG